MKIHTKRILAAILSTGVIASTLGATLTSAAADVKVAITDNYYTNNYWFFSKYYLYGFIPIPNSSKPTRYYTPEDQKYYNNAVKVANFCRSLGFNQESKKFDAYVYNNNQIKRVNSDTLYISYALNNSELYKNAIGQAGSITVGSVDSTYMNPMSSVPDIIAHEYVHLVEHRIAGWDASVKQGNFEGGALMEAYSDILGELSETNPDWRMGTALFKNNSGDKCLRDLRNPVSTYTPKNSAGTRVSVKFYDDYNKFKTENPGMYPSRSDVDNYSASTIVSHAAYLMSTSGIRKDVLAQLWYDSLSEYKNAYPSFSECRTAVVSATNKYAAKKGYSARNKAELLGRVNWAFDKVNIK
ncbi:MAG: M4 family metallopeptidase [Ruminococcus sp.]|nr:M4 family metallopeptidase [Ruminococcus sp.]